MAGLGGLVLGERRREMEMGRAGRRRRKKGRAGETEKRDFVLVQQGHLEGLLGFVRHKLEF